MSNTRSTCRTVDEPVSQAVLDTVAAYKDTEPTALSQPLYDVVDPDALDTLFADGNRVSRRGRVSFRYSGCEVTVESDGRVLVRSVDERSETDSH